MIPLMKKNASKERTRIAWAKTQAAYEAGFRYVPEAHKEDLQLRPRIRRQV
jgi:hypothetical protein